MTFRGIPATMGTITPATNEEKDEYTIDRDLGTRIMSLGFASGLYRQRSVTDRQKRGIVHTG